MGDIVVRQLLTVTHNDVTQAFGDDESGREKQTTMLVAQYMSFTLPILMRQKWSNDHQHCCCSSLVRICVSFAWLNESGLSAAPAQSESGMRKWENKIFKLLVSNIKERENSIPLHKGIISGCWFLLSWIVEAKRAHTGRTNVILLFSPIWRRRRQKEIDAIWQDNCAGFSIDFANHLIDSIRAFVSSFLSIYLYVLCLHIENKDGQNRIKPAGKERASLRSA